MTGTAWLFRLLLSLAPAAQIFLHHWFGRQPTLALLANGLCLALIWLLPWLPRHIRPRHPGREATRKSPDPAQPGTLSRALEVPQIQEKIEHGFPLLLQLLRGKFRLTTAILLCADPSGQGLKIEAVSSNQPFRPGSHVPHSGVLAALDQERKMISGHPASPRFNGLPYYPQGRRVGGFLVLAISPASPVFLCLDRDEETPWHEEELELIQAAADKIAIDLLVSEQWALIDHQTRATNQICGALQELNSALGQETAFAAVERAIAELTGAEFIALTLREKQGHKIVRASGFGADNLAGTIIPHDRAGLIARAVDLCHAMPHNFSYNGPAPVFFKEQTMKGFHSLLILPLHREKDKVIGTLVMAGRQKNLFSEKRLEILKMVASHIVTTLELAQAHEEISLLATTDSLTGLANRRSMQIGFNLMKKRAERTATPLAVLLCDIDFFKKINDRYGHPFGDEVLRGVAAILKKSMRAVDLACRYGGEEFLLILENSDTTGGCQLSERIRKEVEKTAFRHEGKEISVTMSCGVASSDQYGLSSQTLIDAADQALYRAKEAGRNQTCLAGK